MSSALPVAVIVLSVIARASTNDGTLFVANLADGDDSILKAWDMRKRAWVFQLYSSPTLKRLGHAISPDGRTLVDRSRYEADEPCWAVWDLRNFTCAIAGPSGSKLDKWCFSGDGRRLARLLHVHLEIDTVACLNVRVEGAGNLLFNGMEHGKLRV